MEWVAEVARRALVISGLAVMLDVVLPRGNVQKCARVVLSVMLLGVMLEPVVALCGRADKAEVTAAIFTDLAGYGKISDNTAEIIAAGGRMADETEAAAREELAGNLARQIEAAVRRDGVVECDVQVEIGTAEGAGNNWGRVFIMLAVDEAVGDAAALAEQVRADVAAAYGLAAADVRVSVVAYGGE